MVYGLIILVLTLLIAVTKRRVGLSILVAIVAWFIIGLWSSDLAQFIVNAQVNTNYNLVKAIIEIVAVIIPSFTALARSFSSGRSLTRRLLESFLFSVLVVYLLRISIGSLINLDYQSIQLSSLMVNFEKIILTVTGIFGIRDILGKNE